MLVNKNKKYIIILSVVIIGLLGTYFLLDLVPNSSQNEADNEENIYITQFELYDISRVDIKNEKGEFTVLVEPITDSDGEKTATCEIDGFDDAPIMSTLPNTIANDCTMLTAHRRVNGLGVNDSEYGIDTPVSKVTITLSDKSELKLSIGDLAPNTEARYVGFENDSTVYLVDSESLQSFFYSIYDIMDPTVTDSDGDEFISLTVENSACSEAVVIEISSDERHSAVYNITSPIKRTANNDVVDTIAKNLRSFTADRVVAYNVGESEIEKFGLNTPYATATAVYDDSVIAMISSKPDNDGNVYIMLQGKNIIYQAAENALPWISADITSLKDDVILEPVFKSLKSVTINTTDHNYKFDIQFDEYTDENNELKTKTTVKSGEKEISATQFKRLIEYISTAETTAPPENADISGTPTIKLTYSYISADAEDDVLEIYSSGTGKAVAVLNGMVDSYVYDSYVSRIISELEKL